MQYFTKILVNVLNNSFPKIGIIPIGGEAVRLRPLSEVTSKAMVRFMNRPLLEFIILELARQGVDTVYLGVRGYYNYVTVYDYFREGYWFLSSYPSIGRNIRLRYMPLYDSVGNGDAVRVILEYYDVREPFITVMGDVLFHTNLNDAYDFHVKMGADMTIVLMHVDDVREFGVAKLGDDNRIEAFVEKPMSEEAPSNLANTGIYIFSDKIRDFFTSSRCEKLLQAKRMDFGKDIIPALIEDGYRVYGYIMREGYWFDIGTPDRYLRATRFMLYNADMAQLEAREMLNGVFMQGKSETSRKLHMEIRDRALSNKIVFEGRNLLGRHIKIGDGSVIRDSVVGNYTIIGGGCYISNSVIMDRVFVGNNVRIENSIIARHAHIENNVEIIDSVLGDNSHVGENTKLCRTKIWPHRRVSSNARLENFEIL